MLQDVRYALRTLRLHPAFALTALLTLALGIGANTAIFSAVHAVLLHSLPFPQADRLVTVWGYHRSIGAESASLPDFLDWRDQAHSFTGLAARANTRYTVAGTGEPVVVSGARVSADYFRVLGAAPRIGRDFRADEERAGAARVAILSQGFWQREYGSRPDVVGQRIVLNGVPHTVVGAGARGLSVPQDADVWTPLVTDTTLGRRADFLDVVGRLAPGVSQASAQSEMSTIARRLERAYPGSNAGWGVQVIGVKERIVGPARPALLVFMGAVGLVLLIACANVANLMLARVASRERELTVRVALGASRRQLVRQLLTESVLLSLAGGGLGILIAVWGVNALRSLDGSTLPRADEIAVSGAALAFALGLSVATGLLFGLAPAVRVLRYDFRPGLARGGRTLAGSGGRMRLLLVVGETALACVLLVGAALLLGSFTRLQRVDPGFTAGGVLTARVTLPAVRYEASAQQAAFATALLERLRGIPAVTAAALASAAPLDRLPYWSFAVEGAAPPPPDVVQDAAIYRASPEYFGAYGIPLVQGRLFDAGDREGATPVAIIGSELARRYWGATSPLGARITFGNPSDTASVWLTIVGVVGDVRQQGPTSPAYPQAYVPFAQLPSRSVLIGLRTGVDPIALAPALKRALGALDPSLALADVTTMNDRVAASMARPRLNAVVIGGFAAMALVLAALGVYGVISYGVVQRTRELGIRMALGARADDVVRLVLREGMMPVLAGLMLGLAAAAAGSQVLRSLLYGVEGTDPATYVFVAAFLAAVALGASYIPARRAARSDPVRALRAE